MQINERLREINAQLLRRSNKSIVHPVELPRVYEESGIQIMLAQNVRNNFFDFSNEVFMSNANRKELAKNLIETDDVVLTRSGANFGQSSSFKETKEVFACADVLVIKKGSIKGGFLSTYLNTNQGRLLLNRGSYGMAQPHIAPPYIYSMLVPRFGELENKIDELVIKSVEKLEESKALYAEAENLLLDELGLRDWSPSADSISVKSFAESFADTGRLDAEYYQPHYFEIIEKCKSYHLGWASIKDTVESMTNGVESREFVEEGVPYIRVTDIGYLRINLEKAQKIPFKEASDLIGKIQLKKDDVLTVRSGSIGQAAIIKKEDVSAVLSSHLIRLRIKENAGIKGVYLALFLETLAGNQQIMMQSNGAIVPEISQPALSRIVVPLLDISKQENLEDLIQLSEIKRKQSKQLLEIAKRAVELAIETSEDAATVWIDEQIQAAE